MMASSSTSWTSPTARINRYLIARLHISERYISSSRMCHTPQSTLPDISVSCTTSAPLGFVSDLPCITSTSVHISLMEPCFLGAGNPFPCYSPSQCVIVTPNNETNANGFKCDCTQSGKTGPLCDQGERTREHACTFDVPCVCFHRVSPQLH